MADKKFPEDDVKIHAPSRKLHEKISAANLDQLLTPEVIQSAQEVIHQSSDQFLAESIKIFDELEANYVKWRRKPEDNTSLIPIITEASFSLKTKAGLAGYDLVFDLGKSLQLHCEKLSSTKKLTIKDMEIVRWHIESMRELFRTRTKGKGGTIGAAISSELDRLLKTYTFGG
jgi:hypothetical protein